MIDIRPLKSEIAKKFPNSTLDKTLRKEPDSLTEEQFLAKAPIWDTLSHEGL